MDLASVVQVVETACQNFNNPSTRAQAEEVLKQFRGAAQPYEACRYLIEHSNDPSAQFQAVLALRDAALREWTSVLDASSRRDLLRYLMHAAIVKFSGHGHRLVCTQSAAAAATLLKRLWEETSSDERGVLISEINSLAEHVGTPEARCASMHVLNCVVQEFAITTATPMGLPWDYHEQCRKEMQDGYLLIFLQHALNVGRSVAEASLCCSDGGTCAASLNLLSSLLSWNHTVSPQASLMQRPDASGSLHCRPPVSWREVLLDENSLLWILHLSRNLHQITSKQQVDKNLESSLRQVITQLCSLSGDIFSNENKNSLSGDNVPSHQFQPSVFLGRLLPLLLHELSPAEQVPQKLMTDRSDAILDTCRALFSAASIHRSSGFCKAVSGIGLHPEMVFKSLSDVTAHVLSGEDLEEIEEAADILLSMWTELVTDPCWGAVAENHVVAQAAGSVFSAIMQRELSRAAKAATEDEVEYEGGEQAHLEAWLSDVATIGRAACEYVLPMIIQHLEDCQSNLQVCMKTSQDPSSTLERLCWILQSASSILADSADGEVPQVPVAISDACATVSRKPAGTQDTVIGLSQSLLAFASFCKENAGCDMISPRLMEELCKCLGRWADTYLISNELSQVVDDDTNSRFQMAFGAKGNGQNVVQFLMSLVNLVLIQYPGETSLHLTACKKLLAALVRRDEISQIVVHSQAWGEMSRAFAIGENAIVSLESNVQRILARNMVGGAIGFGQASIVEEFVHSLLHRLSRTILELANLSKGEIQRADKVISAVNAVHSLRGGAKGSRGETASTVYFHVEGTQGTLSSLLEVYQSHPWAYIAILDFAADAVAFLAPYLHGAKQLSLFDWSINIVAQFASHAKVLTSFTEDKLDDQVMAICSMLRLLSELTNADAPDDNIVATAVFSGLHHILPLIHNEHLKFPHLRRDFFWLLVGMVEAHASRVTALPISTFHGIIGALQFGIGLRDEPESEAAVFEAIAALARHELVAQTPLLTQKNVSNNISGLECLFEALLNRLLVDDSSFEAVDFAAEAAHPLLLIDGGTTASKALELIVARAGGDQENANSMQRALKQLQSFADSGRNFDRASRHQFQMAFRTFIIEARNNIQRK